MCKQGELQTLFEQAHLNVIVSESLKNEFPEVKFLLGSEQSNPKCCFLKMLFSQ